jgi:ABC-2 type transport system ATP-binding protein
MIKTIDLNKKFGKRTAVNNLNLHIEEGTTYGLLGPNGAGKTTTIKMLTSLLAPDSGEVYIDGKKMGRNQKEVKAKIGMVSQHFSFDREMTALETLRFHGLLHKMSSRDITARSQELLVFAKMEDDADKQIMNMSGGTKRKLMIIRSVMHQPKILFLDEPTVGLDASIRRAIWDLMKKFKQEGMTILLTTHYIDEANSLCDTIGMMSKGNLKAENSPDGFVSGTKPYVVEVFTGEKTEYNFFASRHEALEFSENIESRVIVRNTNLEDTYVQLTNDSMDSPKRRRRKE